MLRFPVLADAGTTFVTVRHEPPFTGQLPSGRVGATDNPVVQFLVVSNHPRPIQRKHGLKHITTGTVWEQAWETAEREWQNGHYVNPDAEDPLEVIYGGLLLKHTADYMSLKQMTN